MTPRLNPNDRVRQRPPERCACSEPVHRTKRPPTHPTELAYPCCLPALGELGKMSPRGGLSQSLGEGPAPAQGDPGQGDFTGPVGRPVRSRTEDSPSGLWRSLGKRVGLTALRGSNPLSSATRTAPLTAAPFALPGPVRRAAPVVGERRGPTTSSDVGGTSDGAESRTCLATSRTYRPASRRPAATSSDAPSSRQRPAVSGGERAQDERQRHQRAGQQPAHSSSVRDEPNRSIRSGAGGAVASSPTLPDRAVDLAAASQGEGAGQRVVGLHDPGAGPRVGDLVGALGGGLEPGRRPAWRCRGGRRPAAGRPPR